MLFISYSAILVKNQMKLCNIDLQFGNSSLERVDLQVRHSRAARESFQGVPTIKRSHRRTVKAMMIAKELISGQSAYDPSNWENPVFIDIMGSRKRSEDHAAPTPTLISAVEGKQSLGVRSILNKDGVNILKEVRDSNQNSPLHVAALIGDKLILEMILASMIPDQLASLKTMTSVDLLNNQNETPLFLSIKHGNQACTDILLADPGAEAALKQVNTLGMTCFFAAAYAGSVELMERLANLGVDVEMCDNKGNSPLHAAASQGELEAVRFLVSKGWGNVKARNNSRLTPLHWAACNGQADACELLLELGSELNAVGSAEETPCFLAFARRHLETFKTLLYRGGEAVSTDRPPNLDKIRKAMDTSATNDIVEEMQRLRSWPVYFGMKRTYLGIR